MTRTPVSRPWRTAVAVPALLLAVALPTLSTLLAVPPTGAGVVHEDHDGFAVFAVESRTPLTADTVHYVVRVTWSADGHAADSANVTATPIGPDGVAGPPVALQPLDADGRYGGAVTLPGAGLWTVRLGATVPAGTSDLHEQVPLALPVPPPLVAPPGLP